MAGLEADPQDEGCLLGLGRARLEQGERAEAEAALRRLLELRPGHAGAESHLAALGCALGDGAALERLRALAARPGASAFELLNLGAALFDRGELAGAEDAFTGALARAPDSPLALLEVGRLRLLRGDAGGAVEVLERAVLAPGNEPLSRVLLYRAHRARGELALATALATEAARAHPLLGAIQEDLHALAMQSGDAAAALRAASALCALDPSSPRYARLHAEALAAAGAPEPGA